MTDWNMTCTECGNPIRRGEQYVSYNRHIERVERRVFRTAISVKHADELGTYHEACAPNRG